MIGYANHEVYEDPIISISLVGGNGKRRMANGERRTANGEKGEKKGTTVAFSSSSLFSLLILLYSLAFGLFFSLSLKTDTP